MLIACLTVGQTHFEQRAIPIGFVTVVVAGEAPAHRCEGAKLLAELIVGIDARLQRIEPFGLVVAILCKGLHMVVAHVAAHAPFVRQLLVLSQTIEQSSRELRVESHEVSAYTYYIIGTLVAKAGSHVDLRRRAGIEHVVNIGGGADVHQTYLTANGVVAEVDDTHLPALGTLAGDVEHTNLSSLQRVGIVDGSQLPTVHLARRHIQESRQLESPIHLLGDVVDGSQLETLEHTARDVGESTILEPLASVKSH